MQHEDFTCRIDGDEKLTALEAAPLTLLRRKAVVDDLNELENMFSLLSTAL